MAIFCSYTAKALLLAFWQALTYQPRRLETSGLSTLDHCDRGATFLLLESENVEMVRRRGRWATTRVMEAYLQEILYTTFAEGLDRKVRTKILQLAENFPAILEKAISFLDAAVPPATWWRLFQASNEKEHGEDSGK